MYPRRLHQDDDTSDAAAQAHMRVSLYHVCHSLTGISILGAGRGGLFPPSWFQVYVYRLG
jgi:hypothetical protein